MIEMFDVTKSGPECDHLLTAESLSYFEFGESDTAGLSTDPSLEAIRNATSAKAAINESEMIMTIFAHFTPRNALAVSSLTTTS